MLALTGTTVNFDEPLGARGALANFLIRTMAARTIAGTAADIETSLSGLVSYAVGGLPARSLSGRG